MCLKFYSHTSPYVPFTLLADKIQRKIGEGLFFFLFFYLKKGFSTFFVTELPIGLLPSENSITDCLESNSGLSLGGI
uniref:Serine/threonine-protein kinase AFC2 isoform X2 n=1 Tax=Rhizophora mucronata TaxID=61149 RepID=A0A2P2LIX5_RHIMU